MTDIDLYGGKPKVRPFTAAELRDIASRAKSAAAPLAGSGVAFDLDSLAEAAERVAKALEG